MYYIMHLYLYIYIYVICIYIIYIYIYIYYIYILYIYILYIYILYIYIYGCKSKYKVRNKVRDHTRSIPPFHTSVPYLFEGSVPYLCSIPLIHILLIIYLCTFEHVQSDFTCVCKYMNTLYIHEYIPARLRLLCPSPVIELASLCYACSCYLLC